MVDSRNKLNEDQVKAIKQLLKQGMSQRQIGFKFNVSATIIRHIHICKVWKNITNDDVNIIEEANNQLAFKI